MQYSYRSTAIATFAVVLICIFTTPVAAQTFSVIHGFTGSDGSMPTVGLISDAAGNFYGTTQAGGNHGAGTVFKLTHQGSGWILKPLYTFTGGSDGDAPSGRVVFGPDGSLYGTAQNGGLYQFGVVFKLQPPITTCRTVLCPWTETVLYSFTGMTDGGFPAGDLAFDQAGTLYGTADGGGNGMGGCYNGCGVVYELTPSHGSWNYNLLYSFNGSSDGGEPASGVVLDASGNLYGTTIIGGGSDLGTVFELTYNGSGWTESVVHSFQGGGDGKYPYAGLVLDPSGNLFGVTEGGGVHGPGIIFELQPGNGGWNYNVLYSIGLYGGQPLATLTRDNAGNLYGTLYSGGTYGRGAVFELQYLAGSWNYITLHDLSDSDGGAPSGSLIFDARGNLYSTSSYDGPDGHGSVWEITR